MKLLQKIAEQLNISGKISQSSHGEDIMLWRYFTKKNIRDGFFIDVGAYHPKFFNNTWRLRKKLGFRGINIEPTNNIKLFQRFRKNDINIQCLVGKEYDPSVTLNYVTEQPATSGKDTNKLLLKPDKQIKVIQRTLTSIVNQFDVKGVDLLDIDIEGTEMEVLRGYDWIVKPRLILIEDHKDFNNEILPFLTNKGYRKIAQTMANALYENNV